MNQLEAAVMRTLLYADLFQFPMTLEEIHRYLIHHQAIDRPMIQQCLYESPILQSLLCQHHGYIALREHQDYIQIRLEREQDAKQMWHEAQRYGKWLSRIPFVRMVALTGALAVRNPAGRSDDYDYLLITQPGRVWLARAFAILLVRVVRLFGRELCPNYVLASDQLVQKRQDLFIAHEIAQMVPIFGNQLYREMFAKNAWMTNFLPNARPHKKQQDRRSVFKSLLEKLLGGAMGSQLEKWEYQRKRRKFSSHIDQPQADALIDDGHVKGHFQDHGHPVLNKYRERLREYNLLDVEQALVQAGD